jgi:plasmid stability protein
MLRMTEIRAARRHFRTGDMGMKARNASEESCDRPRTPPLRSERAFDISREHAYCDNMKNITVSVDDNVYRQARIKAAERDTSVSALVKQFLTELAAEEGHQERLLRQERELRARVTSFSASDRLSRDELYDRRRR